jgi:predicted lipoprotein with Yx(FWY)xxD motif
MLRFKTPISLLLSGLLLASGAAMAAPAMVADGVLVGDKGMTLYIFDKDTADSGKSVCNGQCATNWPPLMATDADKADGAWTIVTRDDGKKQFAYKGKPVYYWIKDTKAGDKTGDGVGGSWHVAKP